MLSKLSLRSITLAHISLAFVGVMWVLPFLDFRHGYPITTFYEEWEVVIFGLCAMLLFTTKRYWQQVEIPRVVLLPIGLLLIVWVQYFLGKIPSVEQTQLLSLYLLWAALLLMLGHRLRVELGLPLVARVLAVFLVLGAGLNALAGILQHFMWHTFLDRVVSIKISAALIGNMGQPNHFADYIALGLVSIGLLHARGSLRAWQTALLAVPLLFVLVLSGSRSAWLYLLFMALMSYLWQRRDRSFLPLMKYALWLLLGFTLMQFVVQIPWLAGASGETSTVERIFGNAQGGTLRIFLWKESLLIFSRFPFLGAGFGQYAWQHFQLGAELHNLRINGLYDNAHNLVMQLAAETGLAGLSVLFGTLGFWFWQTWREQHTMYHWWAYAVLAVLGIHSLLEYPLWYTHFIGIAAIALGMLESTTYRWKPHNLLSYAGRLLAGALLLSGAYTLVQLYQGYKKLEITLAQHAVRKDDEGYKASLRDGLLDINNNYALMRPLAQVFLAGMIVPDMNHLEDKLALNDAAMRFKPVDAVVYRQIWLLALADRLPEAKVQLQNALWSYPGLFQAAQAELDRWALQDPVQFSALSEFAKQQYAEYQRAAQAK